MIYGLLEDLQKYLSGPPVSGRAGYARTCEPGITGNVGGRRHAFCPCTKRPALGQPLRIPLPLGIATVWLSVASCQRNIKSAVLKPKKNKNL